MSAADLGTKGAWDASVPDAWPKPPDLMTVTSLGEIEECPRRWSLRSAVYPTLWANRGYPSKLHIAALEGNIVHHLLEILTGALLEAGCRNVTDEAAVAVMRKLGGWTKLVANSTAQVVSQYQSNPRVTKQIAAALVRLQSLAPEIRRRAQELLLKVPLSQVRAGVRNSGSKRHVHPTSGVYPEFDLRCPSIGWRGRVDLLVLTPDSCEIIDFKTGAHDPAHAFQLLVYALLWYRDVEVNPDGRVVTKLTLAYRDAEESISAPTTEELADIERELVARRDAANGIVSACPPEARPAPSNCRWCDVRHLCDAYWNNGILEQTAGETTNGMATCDVQLLITARHGERSWDGIVELSGIANAGAKILVRTSQISYEFREGQHLRILDGQLLKPIDSSNEPFVLTAGDFSEVFEVHA